MERDSETAVSPPRFICFWSLDRLLLLCPWYTLEFFKSIPLFAYTTVGWVSDICNPQNSHCWNLKRCRVMSVYGITLAKLTWTRLSQGTRQREWPLPLNYWWWNSKIGEGTSHRGHRRPGMDRPSCLERRWGEQISGSRQGEEPQPRAQPLGSSVSVLVQECLIRHIPLENQGVLVWAAWKELHCYT